MGQRRMTAIFDLVCIKPELPCLYFLEQMLAKIMIELQDKLFEN